MNCADNYGLAKQYLLESATPVNISAPSSRSEGLLALFQTDRTVCMIDLRCQSDFVSLNPEFASIAAQMAKLLAFNRDHPDSKALLSLCQSKFRESIDIFEIDNVTYDEAKEEHIGIYVHQRTPGFSLVGKAAAIVKLCSSKPVGGNCLSELASNIAKEIVALHDRSIDIDTLLKSQSAFSPKHTVAQMISLLEGGVGSKIHLQQILFKSLRK